MVSGNRNPVRRQFGILKISAVCIGLFVLSGLIFIAGHMIGIFPDTLPESHEASPDQRTRVTIVNEMYGTFGPTLYVVRIGPDTDLLNWIFHKKVIEIDADTNHPDPPTATWINANSVIIKLPVKRDKLAAAIRDGLYPHPAVDHYGSISITYQPQ
jgi:hypothetical protein